MFRLITLYFALMLFGLSSFSFASDTKNYQGIPWIVESNSFAMASFSLDPEAVQAFLPKGMSPHLNDKNKTSLIVEIYSTDRIAGIPAYKVIFIVAEVAGHLSSSGIPGHFAIWGRVDSQESTNFFIQSGFPYKLAKTLEIKPGKFYQALIADDSSELNIQLEPSTDKPFAGQGVVDMLVLKNRNMLKSEVSFLTQANFAKVLSFKVTANNDPVLGLLENKLPDWALVSDKQIFAYSHLVPLKK